MTETQHEAQSSVPVLDNAIRDYVSKRLRHERIHAQAEAAKASRESAMEHLWDLLENEGFKTVNHELGRFTRSAPVVALIRDPEALMEEADMLGLRNVLTQITFHKKEVNALLRERLDKGEDVPAGTEPMIQHRMSWARAEKLKDLTPEMEEAVLSV